MLPPGWLAGCSQVLIKQQQQKALQLAQPEAAAPKPQRAGSALVFRRAPAQKPQLAVAVAGRPAGSPAACLSIALPLPGWNGR